MGGIGTMGETDYGAFRPSASELFKKDTFWMLLAIGTVSMWVVALVVFPMMDDGSPEMDETTTTMLIVAVADTVLTAFAIRWRYLIAKGLAERGIVTKAKVVKAVWDGGAQIECEYSVEGKTYTTAFSAGMSDTVEKAQRHVGREIVLLVDPQKPKWPKKLSKLS